MTIICKALLKGKQGEKKNLPKEKISSVQFSCSVVSDPLRSHESQHTRPPCPSPTPGFHPDSHPLSQWYHPAISSSVVPLTPVLWPPHAKSWLIRKKHINRKCQFIQMCINLIQNKNRWRKKMFQIKVDKNKISDGDYSLLSIADWKINRMVSIV